MKQSGSPIPRQSIVQRCLKDATLLSTLSQVARSVLTLAVPDSNHDNHTSSSSGMQKTIPRSAMVLSGVGRILSFFTATVIELADRRPMDDTKLRAIYSFIMDGLKVTKQGSSHESNNRAANEGMDRRAHALTAGYGENPALELWRKSSCMILAQLCQKTKLAKPVLKSIVVALMQLFVQVSGLSEYEQQEAEQQSSMTAASLHRSHRLHHKTGEIPAMDILTVLTLLAQQQKLVFGPNMLLAALADVSAWSRTSATARSISPTETNAQTITQATVVSSSCFLHCLERLQKEQKYDMESLMRALATTLIAALKPATEEEEEITSSLLKPCLASRVLTHCISRGMFPDRIITFVIWRVFQGQGQGGGLLKSSVITSVKKRSSSVGKDRTASFSEDDDGNIFLLYSITFSPPPPFTPPSPPPPSPPFPSFVTTLTYSCSSLTFVLPLAPSGDRKETLRVLRCVAQRCPLIFDNCVQAAYKAVAEGGFGETTTTGGGDADNSRLVSDDN